MRIDPPSGTDFSKFENPDKDIVKELKDLIRRFLDISGGSEDVLRLGLKDYLNKHREAFFSFVDKDASLTPSEKAAFKEDYLKMQQTLTTIEEAIHELSRLQEDFQSKKDPAVKEKIRELMESLGTLIDTKRAEFLEVFKRSVEPALDKLR